MRFGIVAAPTALGALAYAPVMLARTGQTIGHRSVDTRVMRSDGSRIGGGRAFVREILVKALLMENIALLTVYLLTLLNYLWPLWDSRNQALHDKICDTVVVKTQ